KIENEWETVFPRICGSCLFLAGPCTLRLRYCGVTDEGCAALSSALRSNSSQLRELHLFGNKVGDAGVKLLSALKDDPRYKLKTLML
uniref:NLR family CARD domain containing 6 n=1 Tax=Cyprinus carpio carpio TaxID=630221 RepID=A0A9J7XJG5_CYPCA